jgi:hypothetical protein
MTAHARLVLEDARAALDELVDDIQGSLWRRRWTAAVVLLRTVINVLEAVDTRGDRKFRQVVREMRGERRAQEPEPAIFWRFIHEDRNLIAHQYKHRAGQNVTMHGVGVGSIPYAETTYDFKEGPFVGQDPRRVAREALRWLEDYLDEVDRRNAGLKRGV